MDLLIPNDELSQALLPASDATWPEISRFAHSFDGYGTWGSVNACARVAKAPAHRDLTELRTALYFAARAARHAGWDPSDEEMARIRCWLEQLKALVPAGPVRMASRWRPALLQALTAATWYEGRDELAYLALTSKPELPVRDRLAYGLTKLDRCRDHLVAREYRRTDIALLRDGAPQLLVELKACYAFDMVTTPSKFINYVRADLDKCRALGQDDCERFGLLLLTHPLVPITPGLHGVVKYHEGINSALRSAGSHERLLERATLAARSGLSALGPVVPVGFGEGEYAGIRLQLDGWLVGPAPD